MLVCDLSARTTCRKKHGYESSLLPHSSNAVLLPWRSNNPTRRGAASGACADKRNSGVMNLPCNQVAKYCTEKMFAAKLAVSCPKTCGKCVGAWSTTEPCVLQPVQDLLCAPTATQTLG